MGVISLENLPLDTRGSDFFVQGYGTGVLKINSSKVFNGIEMMLDTKNTLGIWDMTGMEGEPGTPIRPVPGDRVKLVTDLAGDVTHVFVYSRTEYMQTFEAECEHCKKVVEWKMYTKTDTLPNALGGHYQLQNDIQLKTSISLAEDVKLCLDLNGYTVNGAQNKRVISTWGVSSELALMDTSESQKGCIVAHNESVNASQGFAVLVYKGAFYMYGGALELRGGYVDGCARVINWDADTSSVKVSGNPVVTDTMDGLNLYWGNKATKAATVQIDGAIGDDASIAISTKDAGPFTGEFAAAELDKMQKAFTPDNGAKTISAVSGDAEGTYRLSID